MNPSSQSFSKETDFSDVAPALDTNEMAETEEQPFEANESANGVEISVDQRHDYDGDRDYYQLNFWGDKESESIEMSVSAQDAKAIFEYAVQNVPADHPEKLYIAYGKAKRFLAEKMKEADNRAKKKEEEKEERYQFTLDKSYQEDAVAKNGQKISVAWMPKVHGHGAYVLEFPEAKEFSIFDNFPDEDREESWKKARVQLSSRPDVAKNMFNLALESLDLGNSVSYTMDSLKSLRNQYDRDYLWNQDKELEHPDFFFQKEQVVNGIKIQAHWGSFDKDFVLFFPELDQEKARESHIYDPYLLLNKKTEDAQRVFDYACERAKLANPGDTIGLIHVIEDALPTLLKRD